LRRSVGTLLSTVLLLAPCTAAASAQQAQPAARARAGQLGIAQLQYSGGGDWYANPSGLPNLLTALAQRTGLAVARQPAHVKLTDPELWDYPYLYLTGHGAIRLSEEEVQILRRYLTSGGFLHADDNYGLDETLRREVARVFPDRPLVELPADHPVYHSYYDFPEGLPKIHQHDGKPAQGFGVFHEGRLVLFYSYESDLGNGWEDAERHQTPPETRERALRMGVNLFMYAIAQVAP
jgi:Domain of unknown function (DUF4159)